jgi:hypothetical protein
MDSIFQDKIFVADLHQLQTEIAKRKMAAKNDELFYDFSRQFADSLAAEFRFVEDVAHGLADSRPDAVQRHLNMLFTAVNIAVSVSAPVGRGIVSFITSQVENLLQSEKNVKTGNRLSSLSKHAPDKRTLLFQQIANEVMYRYGACIYQFLELVGADNASAALDRLARTGAIRIIYYALKRNIGFEHCEKLVRGEFM